MLPRLALPIALALACAACTAFDFPRPSATGDDASSDAASASDATATDASTPGAD